VRIVEDDPLVRRSAVAAAVTLTGLSGGLPRSRSDVARGRPDGVSPDDALPGRLRLVGVHGLEAVAACPLRAVAQASPRASSRRLEPCTVLYTVRDRLTAELHLAHGCADAVAVLVPGDDGDRFVPVVWPTRVDRFGLTVREVDVLALLLARFTDAEIADRLVVSRTTVRSHVRAVCRKLSVGDRAAARRLLGR